MERLSSLLTLKGIKEENPPRRVQESSVKYLIRIWLEEIHKIPPHFWRDPGKKKELMKKYQWGKMSARAKELLTLCEGNVNEAASCLIDKEYYL